MNDVPSLAQQARANLAQALNALQDDNVPAHTQALASIVAEAMNLLHRLEKNHGNAEFDLSDHSTRALLLVRNALNSLQGPEHSHASTESVLESAAQAVGLVHQLNQLATKQATSAPAAAVARTTATSSNIAAPAPSTASSNINASAPSVAPSTDDTPRSPEVNAAILPPVPNEPEVTTVAPASARSSGVVPDSASSNAPSNVTANGATTSRSSAPPMSARKTIAAPAERISTTPERISTNPGALPALDPLPGEVYIEVALGAYSTSNFYKHVVNADIVDGGGLFVASYTPPALAQNVRIRATLTGGFEFEARGTVDWRREMPKSGSLNPLTPPGFGLKFTELSDDARKMVHRYSRSREPFIREADAS